MKYGLLLITLLGFLSGVYPQEKLQTDNQRAVRFFNKARTAFFEKDIEKAIKWTNKTLHEAPEFPEARLLATEIFLSQDNDSAALFHARRLLSIDSTSYPYVWKITGDIYFQKQAYPEAAAAYQAFLKRNHDKQVAEKLRLSHFRSNLIKDSLTLMLHKLGTGVNTPNCEYVNAISLDGTKLFYTVKPDNLPNDRFPNQKRDEDFFVSHWQDSLWGEGVPLPNTINSVYNEGAMNVSADGRYLFFTSCRNRSGYGGCDLYMAFRDGETWSPAQNLGGVVNSAYWDTQPCFAANGHTLYFVSSRAGGFGGADIWKSEWKENNWSAPENLGPVVNTKGEEMAPFLHPDGQTLYFSSDTHPGMGGFDLFRVVMDETGAWSKPENLGYPINTNDDQINLIVDAAGETAYLSSFAHSGDCQDIFTFTLPQPLRPKAVAYMHGHVFDAVSQLPLEAAFELTDLETGETVIASWSQPNGKFMVALPGGKDYGLHVSAPGYLFFSEHFPLRQKQTKPFKKDIPLQKIQPDARVTLQNLFFAFDSDSILKTSRPELNRLLRFLEMNASVCVEIQGYTDDKGPEAYNQKLSELRAKSVFNYLYRHGIAPDRMVFKGFGEKNPVADNETVSGRAKNRRTEIRILQKKQ
jgi:outer membrane protein OmpA-like peptidoglycan-associated protein/tetratricopeptide (TPR) repeat protein